MVKRDWVKEFLSNADRIRMTEMDKRASEAFLFHCRVKNLTSSTLHAYTQGMEYFWRYVNSVGKELTTATKRDMQDWILAQMGSVSDHTINNRIRSLRCFYNYLEEEQPELILENPMSRIPLIRAEKKIRDVLTPADIFKLIHTFQDDTFEHIRNRTMILTCYDSMLRAEEIHKLQTEDVNLIDKVMLVRGKGRKQRLVAFSAKTAKAIHNYSVKRQAYPGLNLFCVRAGGALSQTGFRLMLLRAGNKAGLKANPHLIRHSAATQYLRAGGSPYILQSILGHSSPIVTATYVHLNADDMRNAHERFSPVADVEL